MRVPIEWARSVDGQRRVAAHGTTVDECLRDLAARYPAFERQLATRFELFVNWEYVRLLQGGDTPVRDGDTIQIVPWRA